MLSLRKNIVLAVAGLGLAAAAQAQENAGVSGVTHVLGLEGIPRNAKGTVRVTGDAMQFERSGTGKSQTRFELPLAKVEDVFTGDDSQRVVGGTLQALSMFAPYGGGRFLSLFRHKVDLLTIQYRDSKGALHGVVLTLPDGKAAAVKKQMVDRGARTSVPVEAEMPKDEKKKDDKKTEGKKP
jgi:hypothetical protein